METKELPLMIGDWVLAKPSILPIKIVAIHKKKIGYHAITNTLNWVRIGLLEPIPITAEILEKNGFVDCNTIGEKFELRIHLDKYNYQVVSYYFGLTALSIKTEYSYSLSPTIDRLRIKYVHELQHALKLCNIDKEIEL